MEKKTMIIIAVVAVVIVAAVAAFVLLQDNTYKGHDVKSADDLSGAIIGVQDGTTGMIYLTDDKEAGKLNSQTEIRQFKSGAMAVTALLNGQLNCVVIDEGPAKEYVKSNDGKLKILDSSYTEESYVIYFNKAFNSDTSIVKAVNDAMVTLENNGTKAKITKYYMGTDEERGNPDYKYTPADDSGFTKTLHVVTNAAFPPYEMFDDNNNIVGFDPTYMRAICDIIGYKLEISHVEFATALNSVETGKADCIIAGASYSAERAQKMDPTNAYTTSKQVIIVKA